MDSGRLTLELCEQKIAEHSQPDEINDPCCACEEAKYEVTFEGLWSDKTHPKDFPSSRWLLHFSDIIGASHSADYRSHFRSKSIYYRRKLFISREGVHSRTIFYLRPRKRQSMIFPQGNFYNHRKSLRIASINDFSTFKGTSGFMLALFSLRPESMEELVQHFSVRFKTFARYRRKVKYRCPSSHK